MERCSSSGVDPRAAPRSPRAFKTYWCPARRKTYGELRLEVLLEEVINRLALNNAGSLGQCVIAGSFWPGAERASKIK